MTMSVRFLLEKLKFLQFFKKLHGNESPVSTKGAEFFDFMNDC
jgi:hypothetical protein